ncbi:MAG: ABC transporter ATP-binding protein, partial [Candidatus Thermoplasmatota archaeon]|nr:ABC transporter ATP-binding protein [Candidatus Thermoplasmatota archaeon]
MPSVLVEKVTKNYRDVRALNEVSLNLQEPGCIGILGPNGAGKTTLLKILTNIVKPTEGVALLNGINVSDEPEKALMDVGALVEQPEFYPYLTALETLKFVGRVKGVTEKNLNSEIQRVSRMTGIVEYLGRKTGNFSRGMKQRLSLACALISDPHIIILDEPTFGLDPRGMKEMRDLIKSLNQSKERIIILSTHLIYEAQEICDRVIIINK